MSKHPDQSCELTNMCLIRDPEGRVLLQTRTKSDWPGYTLPGGHIEPGEDFLEALVREVKEETGLTVLNPRLCGVMEFYPERTQDRYLVFLYEADQYSGELEGSSEGRVQFLRVEDVPSSMWAQDMDAILDVCYYHRATGITFRHGDPKDRYVW